MARPVRGRDARRDVVRDRVALVPPWRDHFATSYDLLSLLTIPLFLNSVRELAPTEDQSFMFGIVGAAADATIDQTTFYTEAVNRELMSVP